MAPVGGVRGCQEQLGRAIARKDRETVGGSAAVRGAPGNLVRCGRCCMAEEHICGGRAGSRIHESRSGCVELEASCLCGRDSEERSGLGRETE